jgi:hypothetical protein
MMRSGTMRQMRIHRLEFSLSTCDSASTTMPRRERITTTIGTMNQELADTSKAI